MVLIGASCHGNQSATTASLSGGPAPMSTSGSTTSAALETTDPTTTSASSGSNSIDPPGTTAEPDRMDLGAEPDLGPFPGPPAWCTTRKVDFVFMISASSAMEPYQENLKQSIPSWISAIEASFADFDYHVLVSDCGSVWGDPKVCLCPEELGCDAIDEPLYPCWAAPGSKCDNTLGAGVIFPAGKGAANASCGLPDGRRYLVAGDPNFAETFSCMAQVGYSGGSLAGDTVMELVKPYLSAPTGCNAGFLRDDALLFITLVHYGGDGYSGYNPPSWADVVHYWREDPDTVFLYAVLSAAPNNLAAFVGLIENHHQVDIEAPTYSPGFSEATQRALQICDSPR